MNNKSIIAALVISFGLLSCQGMTQNKNVKPSTDYSSEFSDYWFQGKAELSSYELSQARYGEIRKGEAVLIFVTEDFSDSKQVKLDDPSKNSDDAVKVLKMNAMRKFNTGIYPYSMMESVFTPLDKNNYPNSLKVTTSSQEWCGHTFSQLNLKRNKYHFSGKSYFESEGDAEIDVQKSLLESELFNLIRLSPEQIPTGAIKIIPSGFFTRLAHTKIGVKHANLTIKASSSKSRILEINYTDIERNIKIEFSKAFPFEILQWEETYKSGFGKNTKFMTTTAVKKKTIQLDYWTKNHVADSTYRSQLELH